MSAADLHDLELVWPSLGPTDVIVTGTFDQWSSSFHLVKRDHGFSGTVQVPWGQKVEYKFIVDGQWRCREDRPQEDDGHGNVNNVLQTPDMPRWATPAHRDVPPTLFIPLEDAHNDGYGDVENMVTAVEFHPPAESARGPLPLPVPQITVEGLGRSPSAGTQLDTAGATEGRISPASEIPVKPSSGDGPSLLIDDNDPVVDIGVQAHDSAHLTNGELAASLVPETAKEAISDSGVLLQPEGTTNTPAVLNGVDATTSAPVVASEPAAKPHHGDTAESATSTPTTQASTPTSATLIPKKRRSLLAKIKHIFHLDNNKQGKKEKH